MKIPVPMPLVHAFGWLGRFGNVPVWARYDLRRIDLVIAAGGIVAVGFYGGRYGWPGAVQAAVMFAAVTALALFIRPANDA